jgi:hypothetical protein
MPLPHDFVYEGTAWSATRNPDAGATLNSALLANRRDRCGDRRQPQRSCLSHSVAVQMG